MRFGVTPRLHELNKVCLAPLKFSIDAAAEAVESLITGKCLVSRVVNENEQIVGPGLQFFVEGRFQARLHRPSADTRLSLAIERGRVVALERG